MECTNCKGIIPNNSMYCSFCGKKQKRDKARRGNGKGSIFFWRGSWYAQVTRQTGDRRSVVRKGGFSTRSEAESAIPTLTERKPRRRDPETFGEIYDAWFPTHRAGSSTMGNYHAAHKYFRDIENLPIKSISIDDLQACLDDCPNGKRTKENMKAVCGLVYKYAIPRRYTDLNLAQYLIVDAEDTENKKGFTLDQLSRIKSLADDHDYIAKLVYINCYLGFRPTEFLGVKLEDYDRTNKVIRAGIKTEAGKDRFVTISPKILSMVDFQAQWIQPGGYLFGKPDGKKLTAEAYRDEFYALLDRAGIENPVAVKSGVEWHTYTPHSCRHTFATLMKRVAGADKDKLALIGHSSTEMLRYYQDTPLEDLRSITDKI